MSADVYTYILTSGFLDILWSEMATVTTLEDRAARRISKVKARAGMQLEVLESHQLHAITTICAKKDLETRLKCKALAQAEFGVFGLRH